MAKSKYDFLKTIALFLTIIGVAGVLEKPDEFANNIVDAYKNDKHSSNDETPEDFE